MLDASLLWPLFTIIAGATQTVRNAAQRDLTATLGTAGATHIRFLFGFPFALVFLLTALLVLPASLPTTPLLFWWWVMGAALTQIAATALMLAAMPERSVVVVYAYIKTEPVQAALFGLVFLGDLVSPLLATGILIATLGVLVMALKPGAAFGIRPTLLGVAAGGMFAVSAVGFRGAILSLALPSYFMAATFTLAITLLAQALLLSIYLAVRSPGVLRSIVAAW